MFNFLNKIFGQAEWKNPPFLFLLTTFCRPRSVDDFPILTQEEWQITLGSDYFRAIRVLIESGLLIHATNSEKINLKYKSQEIREILKSQSVSTTGNKSDLIIRLLQCNPKHAESLVLDFRVLKCSEKGSKEVEKYLFTIKQTNPDVLVKQLKIDESKLSRYIKWLITTASGEIIGSYAYDNLLLTIQNLENHRTLTNPSNSSDLLLPTPSNELGPSSIHPAEDPTPIIPQDTPVAVPSTENTNSTVTPELPNPTETPSAKPQASQNTTTEAELIIVDRMIALEILNNSSGGSNFSIFDNILKDTFTEDMIDLTDPNNLVDIDLSNYNLLEDNISENEGMSSLDELDSNSSNTFGE